MPVAKKKRCRPAKQLTSRSSDGLWNRGNDSRSVITAYGAMQDRVDLLTVGRVRIHGDEDVGKAFKGLEPQAWEGM